MIDLSIVIVTYNPGGLIRDCLSSLPAACGGLDHEVIIVDNASQDGTPDLIRREFPQVTLIVNADNRGFAAANNQALAKARGAFLQLLNPDVIAASGSFVQLVQALRTNSKVGVVGARMDDSKGRVALTAYPPYQPGMILWQYLGFDRMFPYAIYGRYRRQCEQATLPFDAAWVQGSCLMFSREVYDTVGDLDERFFLFCEEPDFCERARSVGWRVKYIPAARVIHYESSVVSRFTDIRVRHYHLSPIKYFRKRNQPDDVLILKLGFTLELLGKLVVRLADSTYSRMVRSVLAEMWLL